MKQIEKAQETPECGGEESDNGTADYMFAERGLVSSYSMHTDRKMTQQKPTISTFPPLLLTISNCAEAKMSGFSKIQPMTARNNRISAVTSKVSATEAKLIIALRKELLIASQLIEKDKKQKEKLVEIARTLRT